MNDKDYLKMEYEIYRSRHQRTRLEQARRSMRLWRLAAMLLAGLVIVVLLCGHTSQPPQAVNPEAPQLSVTPIPIPVSGPASGSAEDNLPLYHLKAISFYPVPLNHDLQAHIIRTCHEYGIDPALVMAVIQKESTFDAAAIGDSGNSVGLMQIQERWHRERMERLGVSDLLDPYQNTLVGIDFLSELLNRWGDTHKALMAYNMGESKALSLWSIGIITSQYSCSITDYMEGL